MLKPRKIIGTLCFLSFLSVLITLPAFAQGNQPSFSNKKFKNNVESTSTRDVKGKQNPFQSFKKSTYPKLRDWMKSGLDAQTVIDHSVIALDPSKITLITQSNVKALNLKRRFRNKNTLGIKVSDSKIPDTDEELLFPKNKNKSWKKRRSYPVKRNDFMNFGAVDAGSKLDFFQISSNTSRSGVGNNKKNKNIPDGLQHAVVYAVKNSPYLLVGFDDLYGQNYRSQDLYFAVDIGKDNVAQLATVPEPSTWIMMLIFLLITIYSVKHRSAAESLPENAIFS